MELRDARRPARGRWSAIGRWIGFAGCVLVVGVLYWGQALFVPIALAGLLAFLLAPLVSQLDRWLGRVASVLIVVALATGVVGLGGWALVRQASAVVDELPQYRANIRLKVDDVRGVGQGGTVEKLQKTVDDIKSQIAGPEQDRGSSAKPVVVTSEHGEAPLGMPAWLGPVMEPLATAGLVLVLVIFMLLERQDLRNRLMRLFGSGTLAVTTRAFDEAARRVSRYLSRMFLVNLLFGCGVAAGLSFIGVPYALLWAVLAGVLRFIPYVGIWVGAGAPIAVSLAALPGWTPALMVVGVFVVIELCTTVVLETVLYADAAGISQVALLVAIAFWAWLWGAPGLLLATPLTVCLVVLGKHLPGLQVLSTLLADVPPLAPDVLCYQRLLARDYEEAATLIEEHAQSEPPESVFDALLLPVLAYAERDRAEGRLSAADAREIFAATRELVRDAAELVRQATDVRAPSAPGPPERVLGTAIEPESGALMLEMLRILLDGTPVALDAAPPELLPSELVTFVANSQYRIVCVADLPPRPPSKARYLLRKLRAATSGVSIVVGRWAPPALRDDSPQPLLDAGAAVVATTLLETRDQLIRLVQASGAETKAEVAATLAPQPRAVERPSEATGTG
jgi:predicted PurR-regulated permease PerM